MKAIQIIELLRIRHSGNEWATFTELADGTGSMATSRIDFFAFNTWPSNRFLKIAYEVKVTRNDFMRELNHPLKRSSAELFADECYFACPAGLVKPDEVPQGWGLVEATKGGLRIKKRAMQREVSELPISFIASIARKSTEPPSPLPHVFWRYEGEELNIDQLLSLATNSIEEFKREQRREGVREFKDGDGEYKNLKEIFLAIEKKQVG